MHIRTKRIYEPAAKGDGDRVLVDRVWPRGVKKDEARIDAWKKELAPSTELRKWFGHDPRRFDAFARRYRRELAAQEEALDGLLATVRGKTLTLVYSARDERHNQAVVLREVLAERAGR